MDMQTDHDHPRDDAEEADSQKETLLESVYPVGFFGLLFHVPDVM
jgi:hypothetical protein